MSKTQVITADLSSPFVRFKVRNQNDGEQLLMSNATALDFMITDEHGKLVPELSRTQQHFADDCDVNVQLERFTQTGTIPNGNPNTPKYGDFVDAPEYQEALNIVINAENQFASLDAKIRRRFSNDPELYLEFVNDPDNYDEAVKLGLFIPRGDVTPPVDNKGLSEGGDTPPVSSAPAKATKSPSKATEK